MSEHIYSKGLIKFHSDPELKLLPSNWTFVSQPIELKKTCAHLCGSAVEKSKRQIKKKN